MRIKVTQVDGQSIVGIAGDLRIGSVAEARPELVAMLATDGAIQLDLSELGECDTAGIQLLLMTCASARAKGRACITVNHPVGFPALLDRVGIPLTCFDLQANAGDKDRDDGAYR